MEIEHISVSRIDLYRQCPFRYGLRYDLPKDKRPVEDDNRYLIRGSAVHSAIEKILKDFNLTKEWSMKKVMEFWEESAVEFNLPFTDVQEGKNKLVVWAKRLDWPDKIIDIERRWDYEIDGVPVVLIPDLVEEIMTDDKKILKITDWKTNAFPYTKEKLADDLQAPFYLSQMKRNYPGYDEYHFVFDFVYANAIVPYIAEEGSAEIAERLLIGYFKKIANDKTPEPTPNEYCGTCPGATNGLCPILKNIVNNGLDEITMNKMVASLLGDDITCNIIGLPETVALDVVLGGIEKMVKARKDRLRNDIKRIMRDREFDSYDLGAAKISFKPSKRVEYRAIDVLRLVGNNPITLDTILSVNKTALGKAVGSGLVEGEVIEKLEETASVSYTSPVLKVYYSKTKKQDKKDKENIKNFWEGN